MCWQKHLTVAKEENSDDDLNSMERSLCVVINHLTNKKQ